MTTRFRERRLAGMWVEVTARLPCSRGDVAGVLLRRLLKRHSQSAPGHQPQERRQIFN